VSRADNSWAARRSRLADYRVPLVSETVLEYAYAMGGRVCDLPAPYLDAVAEANRRTYPTSVNRRVADLMAGRRFAGSLHPLLAGLTYAEVRKFYALRDRTQCERYRRARGQLPRAEWLARRRASAESARTVTAHT
jgi:hypothetical protein